MKLRNLFRKNLKKKEKKYCSEKFFMEIKKKIFYVRKN